MFIIVLFVLRLVIMFVFFNDAARLRREEKYAEKRKQKKAEKVEKEEKIEEEKEEKTEPQHWYFATQFNKLKKKSN